MATLSLAMIVRNEELTLGRVLQAAAQFCDEMVVVDTGSTDRTVEIAQACGARVEHFPWVDDFAAARNYSFSKCTGDWIIWLDADDELSPEAIALAQRIKAEFLGQNPDVDTLMAPYNYQYDHEGRPIVTQTRERFLRRSSNPKWVGMIHECIDPGPNFRIIPEFVVEHRPTTTHNKRKEGRNLAIFDKFLDLQTASPRDLYHYGNELRIAKRPEDAVKAFKRYLEIYPEDARDLYSEPYLVRVDLALAHKEAGQLGPALKAAADAIAYDASRAEGYGVMGLIYGEAGNVDAAFPLILAAAACNPPAVGFAYKAFYGETIRKLLNEYKAIREAQNGMADSSR